LAALRPEKAVKQQKYYPTTKNIAGGKIRNQCAIIRFNFPAQFSAETAIESCEADAGE
jgi:hypothetical protein